MINIMTQTLCTTATYLKPKNKHNAEMYGLRE